MLTPSGVSLRELRTVRRIELSGDPYSLPRNLASVCLFSQMCSVAFTVTEETDHCAREVDNLCGGWCSTASLLSPCRPGVGRDGLSRL